jgi:hypothetical protein
MFRLIQTPDLALLNIAVNAVLKGFDKRSAPLKINFAKLLPTGSIPFKNQQTPKKWSWTHWFMPISGSNALFGLYSLFLAH